MQRLPRPPLDFRFAEARALAEAFGFRLDRVSGSHHIFVHPGIPQLLKVHGQAKPYQIRQLLQLVERHNLELAGKE